MYSFLPFLIGPRMCVGYKFALLEMKVILATLLRNFTFELLPDTVYERRSGITMRPSPNVELKIARVQGK
jgi:cytochrome P450